MSANATSLLIVGTGAMASLFASRLSAAGVAVTMLGTWPAGLEALKQQGVTLVEADGRQHTYPVQVTNDPVACAGTQLALVMVKSWQTQRAANQLAVCLAPDGVALTLQNGLGNRETLAQALGSQRVALGVTTIGANLAGPGCVRLAGDGVITLGAHPRLSPLTDLLRRAGFIVENDPDPNALLWGKLIINAAINPLTALLDISNGELLKRPSARELAATIARESASVAVAQGVRLPYPDPVVATETIARRTASNRSSMLQDVKRGSPTEIDAICGAIVQAGKQTGVPTPVNRTLWQLIQGLNASE
ncbi:MAG: 2-dehydropantoate 2-reductase [Anaerolineales bacterium]|nr:2-dehydropantoate 2-reductase [Anaerolineales bacterium]